MKKSITVLGATGSIGLNTLDVVAQHPNQFEVFALTAATQIDKMVSLCQQFHPKIAVMTQAHAAHELAHALHQQGYTETEVRYGEQALCDVAAHPQVDTVMAAIVGIAGMRPAWAAALAGKRLLLANKEALVVGGKWFMQAVVEGGATLLPIDSEHSAVFQSLPEDAKTWSQRVDKIILTASGGPFRQRDPATLATVTPEEACAHPNWVMGRKISVDSATMMNKALEVIEAHYLFGIEPEKIEVLIHPQSVVHSMVQYHDGSIIAQLGTPDMRVPIAYGFAWPDRIRSGAASLDWTQCHALTFEKPNQERFPGLFLAWQALKAPAGSTAVLNAANEWAVSAFLAGELGFRDIERINAQTLEGITLQDHPIRSDHAIDDLMALDAKARCYAQGLVHLL